MRILKFLCLLSSYFTSNLFAISFEPGHLFYVTTAELTTQVKLHTETSAYDEGFLKVSNIHTLYYAQYGNPNGEPVLYLHGGPMAGSSPGTTQFFDPKFYRIIIFDQRGAGKSTPHAYMRENTSQDLIEDIVKIKNHLKMGSWHVAGGSWGSTLAMVYGQAYPQHVKSFILRGIFDGSSDHYQHLLYGMGKAYPEAYDEFVSFLPKKEQNDILKSYYQRVMSDDPDIHFPAAKAFVKYDTICGMLTPNAKAVQKSVDDDEFVLAISRGFLHYAYNDFFFDKNQVQNNLNKISHIPAIIVQGQHDTICPAQNAYTVFKHWPNSSLMFVQDAGHFTSEPGIGLALTAASDALKKNVLS